MKKFTTKRGFTLVEVMVAFVIFAMMAGMVALLLDTTLKAKQENLDIEDEINVQKQKYYLSTQERNYDSTDINGGQLRFNFGGGSDFNVGYSIGDPNAAGDDNMLALDYFVGNVNYDSVTNSPENNNNNGAGSVMNRLDTRLYGANGIDRLTVKMEDKGTVTNGYQYVFNCLAESATLPDSQLEYYAQYKFIFPSTIIDYGYVDVAGNPVSKTESYNKDISVTTTSPNTMRVGSRMAKMQGWPQTPSNNSMFTQVTYKGFWVTLSNPLPADMNDWLGTSASNQTSNKSGDIYVFTPYEESPIYDDDGDIILNEDGTYASTKHLNIFGAFPKTVEETPTPSE